ncbi:hypothetical protein PVAND_009025 [Polypedilum vanderplanki]|uniref:E3 ubiquitin-protein ligase RNF144B n=1 Tax=Polypedilum vanderplanki TaxID=319348 RepID=A0A9J6CBF3_POLVA|nr:hypothetical protein PVAND_009025 [Polypedilum vanderplanki]
MKSILLTSNNSPSNNYSTAVGSHHHHHTNTDVDNNVIENVDKEHYNNKLLSHSNNIKKQVIRNKIISKNDDKLKRVSTSVTGADNNENHPLIESNLILNESDSNNQKTATKLINLRKKNGTTLIFQRKNHSQPKQQCQQQQPAALVSASEYQELKKESFKKRQSLQWPYSVVSNNTTNNTTTSNNNKFDNRNRHSYTSSLPWYDSRYPNAIEEEFENSSLTQFANEDDESNLAEITTIVASSSVLNIVGNVPDNSNLTTNTTIKTMKTSSIENSNNNNVATTTTTTKRWRIEQFLKNLVGKRSSSSTASTAIQATTTTNSNHSSSQSIASIQRVSKSPSAYDLLPQKSSNCGSTISLNKDRIINKSTASLNSTSLAIVHQKLWSVVPLLNRKDGGNDGASCNNLLANLNGNVSHNSGKMRKCETVLALTGDEAFASTSSNCNRKHHHHINNNCNHNHSKSINNLLEPMRPLNRLRNSQSCYVNCEQNAISSINNHQTCSRCSSLLSLAAIGDSNYSLTNGAFVLKNNRKQKAVTKRNSLLDEDLLTTAIVADQDDSSSNHNLIDNDFNSIEPYDTSSSSITKLQLIKGQQQKNASTIKFTCKLCLGEFFNEDKLTTIASCGCIFCTECMRAYVEFEISEGAYELSCPDALCSSQGVVSLIEISELATASLVAKHHRYRLNREVELDKYRLWCPNRNCETICSVIPTNEKVSPSTSSSAIQQPSSSTATLLLPRSVLCPTCSFEFCSSCKKAWHQSITCEENSKRLGSHNDSMMLFDNDLIKNCPMCAVPIEKDEGCAQMMCKRCKHVFCWYCLASLDDDFLLRHYDKGPCKNKLGHSRASVVWHRAQVIGIFAGFGILLLVASPLLLLAAPCIVCCKCKIEESTTVGNGNKLDEPDNINGGGGILASSDHQV